jgi:glucosamine--fructose-6-phosphate aminotransferase (isomerizing)
MNEFLREIRDQPAALRRVRDFYTGPGAELLRELGRLRDRRSPSQVIISGMGSSLFAAYPALKLLSERGLSANVMETSELLHYHINGVPPSALVMLVSQSGETIEMERLLQRLPGRERIISITNMPGSTLGRAGAVTLPMHAGPQLTEVSARSYHNTVATLLLAADALTGSSEVLSRLAPAADAMATFLGGTDGLGERLDEFVGTPSSTSVLARGPSLSTAYQGAFNLKEVARFFAEPMSAAQYRHGPIEVAAPGHLAMVMAPLGPTFTLLRKLTEELLGFGTRVMFVTDTQESLRHDGDGLCAVRHPHLDEMLAPLINLIPLQLFANARAGRLGHTAGRLSKASAVMRVE